MARGALPPSSSNSGMFPYLADSEHQFYGQNRPQTRRFPIPGCGCQGLDKTCAAPPGLFILLLLSHGSSSRALFAPACFHRGLISGRASGASSRCEAKRVGQPFDLFLLSVRSSPIIGSQAAFRGDVVEHFAITECSLVHKYMEHVRPVRFREPQGL
jgi:hypothetical protein